jgi:hypothetical protein
MDISDIEFQKWVKYVFDHPVTDPAWHFVDDELAELYRWEEDPELLVKYLTLLFQNAPELLEPYSDEQVGQAFWYIFGASEYFYEVKNPKIAWNIRRDCIRAIYTLFEQYFAPKLPQISEDKLGEACYMWWDVCPLYGKPDENGMREIDWEVLEVMVKTLNLESKACQQSALHGLGHWHLEYPEFVRNTIDSYLAKHEIVVKEPTETDTFTLDPELLEYALQARRGYVQ